MSDGSPLFQAPCALPAGSNIIELQPRTCQRRLPLEAIPPRRFYDGAAASTPFALTLTCRFILGHQD
jgi:hypothetical protein